MVLTEVDKKFIEDRITTLNKYIQSSEEQIEHYRNEISVLERVLKEINK